MRTVQLQGVHWTYEDLVRDRRELLDSTNLTAVLAYQQQKDAKRQEPLGPMTDDVYIDCT